MKLLYCAKCWQEFDNVKDHNAGSWFKGERLDVSCSGDIRHSTPSSARRIKAMKQAESLPLDAGEPIKL